MYFTLSQLYQRQWKLVLQNCLIKVNVTAHTLGKYYLTGHVLVIWRAAIKFRAVISFFVALNAGCSTPSSTSACTVPHSEHAVLLYARYSSSRPYRLTDKERVCDSRTHTLSPRLLYVPCLLSPSRVQRKPSSVTEGHRNVAPWFLRMHNTTSAWPTGVCVS
jgi:predicted membrane-bound mannosyltransferase